MEQLQTPASFHHFYHRQLMAIASAPSPSVNQLVLALANAIALKDDGLVRLVHDRAKSLGFINANGSEDEHILSYIFSVRNPYGLIHHRRTPAGWVVSFNELRALRPKRDSQKTINVVHKAYDPQSFNFNVVPGEAFWNGQYHHRKVSLFYNKFPIEPYHSLIVPDREANQEQFMEPADHALVWDITALLSRHQPNLVVGYNAHGAGESINHLHYQLIPQASDLRLLRKDGLADYPIPVQTFTDSDKAWRHIHRLQSENRTFNAIYAAGRIYIIERAFQGYHQVPSWTNCFAWYEIMGGIITLEEAAYRTLTDDQIAAVFADMQPPKA